MMQDNVIVFVGHLFRVVSKNRLEFLYILISPSKTDFGKQPCLGGDLGVMTAYGVNTSVGLINTVVKLKVYTGI